MDWLKNNYVSLIAILCSVISYVLWLVHKIKHTDPTKAKAEKQAKQVAKDKRHIEKLNARLEKIEKKYKVKAEVKHE